MEREATGRVAQCAVLIPLCVWQVALFAAWLPHLTRPAADGPAAAKGDARLHHTAYVRYGTEYFGWAVRAYRQRGLPLRIVPIGGGE